MHVSPTLEGLRVLRSRRFDDDRGYFAEVYNRRRFAEKTGFDGQFVQDNESRSLLGVVRGLHYQIDPKAQGKLVRVVRGRVLDVAVDIRRSSATFGTWAGFELSADDDRQLWIPRGFAHGFLALTDGARVLYKTTEYYSREHERAIRWDDPAIGIVWPTDRVGHVRVSDRDAAAPLLEDAEVFG